MLKVYLKSINTTRKLLLYVESKHVIINVISNFIQSEYI